MGEPGRRAVIESLPHIRDEHGIDFIIVNGENSANGRGITSKISIDLLRAGAAVITTGDHIWDQREIAGYLPTEPRLLRPINYPPGVPGAGSIVLDTAKGPIGVINVQGRTFMKLALENPFLAIQVEVEKMRAQTKVIFVDMHAEATSEKVAMGRFLDGKVSAVVGTHTHVQTSDERILPGGTAFLCDAGMCGPLDSIIGSDVAPILERFLSAMPSPSPVARTPEVQISGAIVSVDAETGHAVSIERVQRRFEPNV